MDTTQAQRIERIHDIWRKAARHARAAVQRFSDAVAGDATSRERRRLGRRAEHMCKRAHALAMLEVREVFKGRNSPAHLGA